MSYTFCIVGEEETFTVLLLFSIPHLISANQLAATDFAPVTVAHGHLHVKWLDTVDNV